MDLVLSAATHRSGSTLLQRIFNAREKTLIWGENGGCLTDFCKMYQNALYYADHSKQERAKYFNGGEDPNHWIATMTPPKGRVTESLTHSVRAFHSRLYEKGYRDTHDLIGYKEVRYGEDELKLCRRCYPQCTIVLLVRHPVDVWKSVSQNAKIKRYQSVQDFAALWNRQVTSYIKLSKTDPDMHLIRYEDIIERDKTTMDLIKRLGMLEDKQMEAVMSVKISSSSRRIPVKQEKIIRDRCQNTIREMGYSHD